MNCYVLVGGRSSRMGASKSELFLARVAAAARPAFDDVIAVDRPGGNPREGIRTIFEPEHDDEAPIFGVRRALEDARAKCFVLAVDYPLITTELLARLARLFAQSARPMLVPHSGGHPHVLCAGYSHTLLPEIDARIVRRQYDLRSLAAASGEIVDCGSAEELLNVNTPEEREKAERVHEQRLLTSR